jgi:SAM-dependent methyltransferase
MSTAYALAYRWGFRPWERAAREGREQLDRLLDREQDAAPPFGRALDLGCGRGTHTAELARRGWTATGVDNIPRAVREAQDRGAGSGARFLVGDVTELPPEVGDGYRFVLDVGCFHGLSDPDRTRYGAEVDRVTGPGAALLVLAFAPGGRGPLPRGAGPDDLLAALPGWTVTDTEPAETVGMPAPLRSRRPAFHRLVKA